MDKNLLKKLVSSTTWKVIKFFNKFRFDIISPELKMLFVKDFPILRMFE